MTAHQSNISYHGWTGSGYIILDPTTGTGAYLIDGGANGAFVLGLIAGLLVFFFGAAGLIGALGLFISFIIANYKAGVAPKDVEFGCFFAGFTSPFVAKLIKTRLSLLYKAKTDDELIKQLVYLGIPSSGLIGGIFSCLF